MQMKLLARYDVNSLSKLGPATLSNLDVVTAGPEVYGFILVRCARVGAIDEHLGVLHLGIQLDLTGVRMPVVITAIGRTTPSPIWSPIRRVPSTTVIRAGHHDESTDSGRRTHRR